MSNSTSIGLGELPLPPTDKAVTIPGDGADSGHDDSPGGITQVESDLVNNQIEQEAYGPSHQSAMKPTAKAQKSTATVVRIGGVEEEESDDSSSDDEGNAVDDDLSVSKDKKRPVAARTNIRAQPLQKKGKKSATATLTSGADGLSAPRKRGRPAKGTGGTIEPTKRNDIGRVPVAGSSGRKRGRPANTAPTVHSGNNHVDNRNKVAATGTSQPAGKRKRDLLTSGAGNGDEAPPNLRRSFRAAANTAAQQITELTTNKRPKLAVETSKSAQDKNKTAPKSGGGGKTEKATPKKKNEFEVSSILQSRRRGGRVEYLVEWQGFGRQEQNTWEPIQNLTNCDQALKKFFTK